MKTAYINERSPARRHMAARMLARSMTLLGQPNIPYRSELIAMYLEEDGTPQSDFRRELSLWAGVSDRWLMDRAEDDLNLALELEQDKAIGMYAVPPKLHSDEAYQRRHEAFRDWLFSLVVDEVEGAIYPTIH